MRRVSSLNDLMNFRQALQIRPPGSLDRPNSVLLNEDEFDTRSCSSDEYENADQLFQDKKEAHSSLKRIGSALHASFRKIRPKGPVKDECGYETLPNKNDSWEKRSFRNLLISSKRWMGSNSKSPDPHKLTRRSYERETSQSDTCLLVPPTFNGPVLSSEPPVLNSEPPPCNGASEGSPHMVPTRTVSVSSGISVPLSVYSDYEIPDEVLEASVHLRDTSLQNSPTPLISEPSQSTLSVNHLPISKSRSAHEIWNLDSDRVIIRSRANSQTHSDRSKHTSCLIDYSPTSSRSNKVKLKRKGVLSRSFNRSFNRKKYGKSISDILGTPPAVPTDRRPSILCTCCNSVHVCQTLPGMSLTRKATLSSSPSKIYENTRLNVPGNELEPVSNEAESDYETLPGVLSQKSDLPLDYETFSVNHNASEDEETDYEDVDNEETSLTHITSTLSLTEVTLPDYVASPDSMTMTSSNSMTSPDSMISPNSMTSSITDSVFVTSPTFVMSSDCASSERDLLECSEMCSTPVLISPGEIAISLEL